jgi:type 1 fimbriae regulatory protein FimB
MQSTNTAPKVVQMRSSSKFRRKYQGPDRPSFSIEQLKAFLHAAEATGKRELAMWVLAFAHGLRVSEIAGMRVSDIRMGDKKINIRRLKDSQNSLQAFQRVNGYHEDYVLRDYLKERATMPAAAESDVLFLSQKGGNLDRSQIYRIFGSICEVAGIPEQYRHPHTMRHTTGQLLYDGGAKLEEIQMVLGHRSLNSVTVYARPGQDAVSKKVEQIFKRIF